MTQASQKKVKPGVTIASLLLSGLLLGACGGGGGGAASVLLSGIGGTGIVFGTITGFGSVHVNGNRYITANSQFVVDGDSSASQDDLAVGMVVRIEVETENGVSTGIAKRVVYDDEIEGPVAAAPAVVAGSGGTRKTFSIFGQTVTIDQVSTRFENTGFDDIVVDDLLEISGFRTSPTGISATYVKKTGVLVLGVSEVELRGRIANLSPSAPYSFDINGISIVTDAMTEIEVSGGVLANDMLVEVEGVIQTATSILAQEVEEEAEGFGEDIDDISLHGVITDYVSDSDFRIAGQRVDASGAQFSPAGFALGNGLEVEVEGEIVNGILIADEVELREGETKLRSFVSAVNAANNRFEISYAALPGTVTIRVDGQTQFEDEGPLQLPNFSIADLMAGDFVRIEGIEQNDEVVAGKVKRRDPLDPEDSRIEGAVDLIDSGNSITILGIEYGVDGDTVYEEGALNEMQFFGLLKIGDVIEIEDDFVADGVADEVEFD